MKDEELIRTYVVEIEDLQKRGEYARSYERTKQVLSLCERSEIDLETRCEILILAARSAYYVTSFDEALRLCSAAEDLLAANDVPARAVHLFASALVRANVSRRRGNLKEALAILEPNRQSAAGEFPPALVSERLLIEGACRFYLNEIQSAEESLEAALGLAIHYADTRVKSRVLIMLGLVAQNKGLHEAALEYFDRAKDLCHADADHYGEAAAALDAGILLYRRGRFSSAETRIERAREIFASIGWSVGVSRSLLALGSVATYRGEFARAVRCFRDASRIAEQGGFARERALAREYLGDVHLDRGRLQTAEKRYQECLRIAENIAPEGDIVLEIERRLGELYCAKNDPAAAMSHLRRGLRLSQRLQNELEKGAILRCMGRAAFSLGAPTRGVALFKKAAGTLQRAGCDFELGKTHVAFAEMLLKSAASPREDACRGSIGTDDLLDEAWSSAVEAGHIFGALESDAWKAAAGRCIDRVIARRGKRFQADPVLKGGKKIVKIEYSPEFARHEGFVGVSEAMLRLHEQVRFASGFDRPVLVTGETGTGKELVARMIHALSARSRRPFVALNCAAVPDHLFESEFFGHRRGCFTGALTDRIGLFEEANGGTLFLDEVGELTTLQQVKLLRVLQEGKIRRIGENCERAVNVRIVSATNQNLEEKLGKAALREDFYYRINAEHLLVPSLRERREDIVPLVAFCLCANAGDARRVARIEEAALKCLQRYSWPGNVRELFAVLDRAKYISNGGAVTLEMLPERIKARGGTSDVVVARPGAAEPGDPSQRLRKALDLCGGNKAAAARWLGISRGTIYKELRRSGLFNVVNNRNRFRL
ncbi:MAG: sigma 54-interacting transcriptional regulator [Candidatus Krumholzibacteriia bacterium]